MKKKHLIVGTACASMFLCLAPVSAADLSTQIETGAAGLGDSIKFEKTYDSEKDLNKVLVKLLVDKNSINTVLSQKSSTGSNLSIFYFSLNPNLEATNFRKGVLWYGDGLQRETYEAAIADLETVTAAEAKTNEDVIWPNALSVQYYDKAESSWVTSDTMGDGNTSIKDDLLNKLGLTNDSELIYGENYRFSMYDKYTQVWRFDMLDENDTVVDNEIVAIDWEIEFPIAGKVEDRQVLFASLEDALGSDATEITVNKDIVVEEDIVIPDGVTLTVNTGVTVEVKDGVTLTNNGTILGSVKIDGVNKKYSIVEVLDTNNGNVVVDKDNVSSGDTVTVTVTANENYELDSIKVIDKVTGTEVKVTNNKFVMPENDVEVKVTFKEIVKEENPKTGDNIILYFITGILSLGAIIINSKLFKKIFN